MLRENYYMYHKFLDKEDSSDQDGVNSILTQNQILGYETKFISGWSYLGYTEVTIGKLNEAKSSYSKAIDLCKENLDIVGDNLVSANVIMFMSFIAIKQVFHHVKVAKNHNFMYNIQNCFFP